MQHISYSPRPITDYYLADLPTCEARTISKLETPGPLWNFFWLSNAGIDIVPAAGKGWWRSYSPITGLLVSIVKDVDEDPRLGEMLDFHPLTFIEWFEHVPHRDLHTYEVGGGTAWVDRVLERAAEAADRLVLAAPPVSATGNVLLMSDFRRP